MQIIPSILFIDGKFHFKDFCNFDVCLEGAVTKQANVERYKNIVTVTSTAQRSKFQTFFIALEQVFNSSADVFEPVNISSWSVLNMIN